jgi:hypothetical protein
MAKAQHSLLTAMQLPKAKPITAVLSSLNYNDHIGKRSVSCFLQSLFKLNFIRLKSFLLIALMALCSAGSKKHPLKDLIAHTTNAKTVLLEYTGSVTGSIANFAIGAQLSMDTSIGFRYDVTFQNGNSVLSHVAFFYKFSTPHQTIYYNYLNHKTEIIKQKAGDSNNNVSVIGTDQIDSFSCTHLNHTSKHGSEDYWMSTSVPGFQQLCQVLKYIDPNLMSSITETIFKWGGLVRIRMVDTYSNGQTTMVLNLIEAQTDLVFEPTTFDVPK